MWHWGYYILVRRWFKMPISTENKRMQQLTGRFADLNTSNMLVGEFAVPNDHNPVVKMDNGKIREIPLLSDMDSYENKIQEVNGAIVKLNNEYESTKNQLVAATKANADSAAKSAAAAASSASSASTYKDNAKTYMDNANAYAKEAKTAASSITGALKPKGTVTFANLPTLSTVEAGAMYNISTAFTSNANFKDGGNITYPAGTNVYKTEDGMWDCLAGELGDYLMKDDIDTAVEESMPDYTASTQLTELVSGEKLSTALGKIKTAVKNVISLVKLLGTTDISKIGNGTVTGAISSLNSNISELVKIKMYNTQTNNIYEYFDAIEGYSPIAVIYGHPSDNLHCTGFNKTNWMDASTGQYVAWFSDKIGEGSKYIVIYIKIN
jgi:biotin operon repressor